ncbi:MAG: PepSY domain-containing protein [Propionibacteriaceae bacterium]|nr:PepSY domain-containing protein [Propionibacteriaceae bacterium]
MTLSWSRRSRRLTIFGGAFLAAALVGGISWWAVAARPDTSPTPIVTLGGPLVVTPSSTASVGAAPSPVTEPAPNAPDVSSTAAPLPASSTALDIGVEAAVRIALAHAGVPEGQATVTNSVRSHRGEEKGLPIYEIEFYYAGTEYDYDIAIDTGAIIEFDYDSKGGGPPPSSPVANNGVITEDEARAIVLGRVPGSTQNDLRIRLDYENNRAVWEGSLVFAQTEYDFEIEATTGQVLEWEAEWYPYG